MASFLFIYSASRSLTVYQLKEQLELNAATRSLILTILASFYIPLAFVSSYFGMHVRGFTEDGLVSTTTFWQISVPLVVASIIIPVTFSGLLIRILTEVVHSLYRRVPRLLIKVKYGPYLKWWYLKHQFLYFRNKIGRTSANVTNTGTNAA